MREYHLPYSLFNIFHKMEWWEILGLLYASNENIKELNGQSSTFGETKESVRYDGRKKIKTVVKPAAGTWNYFKRKK